MDNKPMGRVLSFEKSPGQMRALALRRMQEGDPLGALDLLRGALSRDMTDAETILTIADVYASIGCYALSNRAYGWLAQDEAQQAACFYGMGENHLAVGEPGLAHDCFAIALQADPESPYVDEIIERLSLLEDAQSPGSAAQERIHDRMGRVMVAMDKGRPHLATRLIRRVISLDGRSSGIRAMQAFALLAAGEKRRALEAARHARRMGRADVRALCAMASSLHALGSHSAARQFLRKAAGVCQEEAAFSLMCQTACEMGEDAFVAQELEALEKQAPYREHLLYTLAVALAKCGRTEEALRRLHILRRINPTDAVWQYWLSRLEDGAPAAEMTYAKQVPLPEMLVRLDRLKRYVHEGAQALARRFELDDALECLLRWGLFCPEPGVAQAMCGILSTLSGPRAKALLGEVLLSADAPELVKQSALISLYSAGAHGPHYAIAGDRMALVHISPPKEIQPGNRKAGGASLQIFRAALRALSDTPSLSYGALRKLSLAAAQCAGTQGASLAARAVVLAYCRLRGTGIPFSSTMPHRRKAGRLASRIIREAYA